MYLKNSSIFIKFENVVCKLFQFGRLQNLSFGKELIGRKQFLTRVLSFRNVVRYRRFRISTQELENIFLGQSKLV